MPWHITGNYNVPWHQRIKKVPVLRHIKKVPLLAAKEEDEDCALTMMVIITLALQYGLENLETQGGYLYYTSRARN